GVHPFARRPLLRARDAGRLVGGREQTVAPSGQLSAHAADECRASEIVFQKLARPDAEGGRAPVTHPSVLRARGGRTTARDDETADALSRGGRRLGSSVEGSSVELFDPAALAPDGGQAGAEGRAAGEESQVCAGAADRFDVRVAQAVQNRDRDAVAAQGLKVLSEFARARLDHLIRREADAARGLPAE